MRLHEEFGLSVSDDTIYRAWKDLGLLACEWPGRRPTSRTQTPWRRSKNVWPAPSASDFVEYAVIGLLQRIRPRAQAPAKMMPCSHARCSIGHSTTADRSQATSASRRRSYQSGGMDRDRRISRAGNPRAKDDHDPARMALASLPARQRAGSVVRVGALTGRTRRIALWPWPASCSSPSGATSKLE